MSIYAPVRHTMTGLLSTPRLSTYLSVCAGDLTSAVELYRWNVNISMALFESLHYLEVALRNRIDEALSALAGPENDWLDAPPTVPLNSGTRTRLEVARRFAAREHPSPTHGHVLAEITFGFWQWLFATNYADTLWRPALREAFNGAQRSRLHRELQALSATRNRIAHHEPLLAVDIEQTYARLLGVAEWIDPRLGWWIDTTSRVERVNRHRPIPIIPSPLHPPQP